MGLLPLECFAHIFGHVGSLRPLLHHAAHPHIPYQSLEAGDGGLCTFPVKAGQCGKYTFTLSAHDLHVSRSLARREEAAFLLRAFVSDPFINPPHITPDRVTAVC